MHWAFGEIWFYDSGAQPNVEISLHMNVSPFQTLSCTCEIKDDAFVFEHALKAFIILIMYSVLKVIFL